MRKLPLFALMILLLNVNILSTDTKMISKKTLRTLFLTDCKYRKPILFIYLPKNKLSIRFDNRNQYFVYNVKFNTVNRYNLKSKCDKLSKSVVEMF